MPRGDASRLPKGRPKGCKNKFSRDVKEMVIQALNKRGGISFFEELDAPNFARVVAKIIPTEIKGAFEGSVTHKIEMIDYSKAVKTKDAGSRDKK